MGGPPSPGPTNSSTGARSKESDKQQGTFFLGRYRVVDEIGVGGMASVHLARMDGPGGFQKWVAIKRIHPHLVEDDQFVDMFLDEARIAAGINHANVAQVFDLGKDDNTYWIAMEYLHGEPLREVMRRAEERRLRISPELAARICSDAAEGLHAAHELRGKNGQLLGLVHRDVTPHNLFLTYDGYTKVVDFGIAKVADRLSSTRAGTLKGKLAYMSPEQVQGKEVDRTTDIFALGVVLWELTTNQRLFRMDTDLDTLEKVQACVVPPPSSIVADYPIELESIVMKALAKRKQDRFQTAREFSRALQNFLVRRGSFVGSEDVAHFVQQVFADRIQKREAHLAWAAEVTSTINVDSLRSLGSGSESAPAPVDADPNRMRVQQTSRPQSPPASGIAPIGRPPSPPSDSQMVASSLMDDDEDVPTTVATRDHIENVRQPAMPADRPVVRPAAGLASSLPLPTPPAAHAAAAPVPMGLGRGGAPGGQFPGAGVQSAYAPPGGGFPPPPPPFRPDSLTEEHTSAFGGQPSSSDLNNTLALPTQVKPAKAPPVEQPTRPGPVQMGSGQQSAFPSGAYPQATNGQGYPSPPAFSGGGAAQPPPPAPFPPQTSAASAAASTQAFPTPNPPAQPPQSQIETALSLPRPDPAALWLAKQDAVQRGQRRNVGVLIAVVGITALCVIGIGLIMYLKEKPAAPAPDTTSQPAVSAAPTSEPAATAASGDAPSPSAMHGDAPAETATHAAAAGSSSAAAPASVASSKASAPPVQPAQVTLPPPSPAAGDKEAPGFLTIVCTPACDDVLDGGRSLGPAPKGVPVKPGQHRLTVRRGSEKKTVTISVVSGQVAQQRVSMR